MSAISIRYCRFYRMVIEGPRAELLAAGVISEAERLPAKPRGCIEQYDFPRWRKITMLADHRLRVAGAPEKAAELDTAFRAFLANLLEGVQP